MKIKLSTDMRALKEQLEHISAQVSSRSSPHIHLFGVDVAKPRENAEYNCCITIRYRDELPDVNVSYITTGQALEIGEELYNVEEETNRCKYFSGSGYLKCAVNPSTPCNECEHYEY